MTYPGTEQPGVSYRTEPRSAGWPVVLIIACAALGFVASAVEIERLSVARLENRAQMLATQCSLVQGHMEDLGRFMSEPETRIVRLTIAANLPVATIAWNGPRAQGYFFCDNLPPTSAGNYELWAIVAGGAPTRLASIDARAGASVYPFRAIDAAGGKIHLEVTAGPRGARPTPVFTGDVD